MKSGRKKQAVLAVVCFVVLAAPLLFLFARSGVTPGSDEFSRLYSSMVTLFGEWLARFVFCGVWLTLDSVLIWRLFLNKNKDNGVTPIEGLGD
jgi:hypothetical protein